MMIRMLCKLVDAMSNQLMYRVYKDKISMLFKQAVKLNVRQNVQQQETVARLWNGTTHSKNVLIIKLRSKEMERHLKISIALKE